MITIQNTLGDIRAESDHAMLDKAFVETPEFKGVVDTFDFNFIVGRRGTGKSALKYMAVQKLSSVKNLWIFDILSSSHNILAIQDLLHTLNEKSNPDYRTLTYIMELTTKVATHLEVLKKITTYYKRNRLSCSRDITEYCEDHSLLVEADFYRRCFLLLKKTISADERPITIPEKIANYTNFETLEDLSCSALNESGKSAIFFFDNLDEGWTPKQIETSIIGGLARSAAAFKDSSSPIHLYIFSRDNMFRALASLDSDFSRIIEGASLRLKWDVPSLFHLVAERLKEFFKLNEENHTKVWNRVAKEDLVGLNGFTLCTNKTLFRPRDILSLLNGAFSVAAKDERTNIIYEDVQRAATKISQTRLNDLAHEYQDVFPSLTVLINSFNGTTVPATIQTILDSFDEIINSPQQSGENSRDFGVFNSSESCFLSLYSIGFLGVEKSGNYGISFCHDGTSSIGVEFKKLTSQVWVHPCYWDALNISATSNETKEIISNVYDEYEPASRIEISDIRMKQIGSAVADIGQIASGKDGASDYEEWILRVTKILFSDTISNLQLHPNGSAVSRRDIVGTISSSRGFWHRVQTDYKCRQIVFEAKNYAEITQEDVRQLSDYLCNQYGNFGILVARSTREGLDNSERNWVKEAYDKHKKLIFIIPSSLLSQCLNKQRTRYRYDYTDKTLSKRLDTFERSYLSLRSR